MNEVYAGKRVFVTGHTGFKGSWLCEWLLSLGAEVYGYALEPPTDPALFDQLRLAGRLASHVIGDVRDREGLFAALAVARPDFVFHLAAQPLVRLSYREPVETFDANVMGTVHLLDAVRRLYATTAGDGNRRQSTAVAGDGRPVASACSVVCITTDKVYENNESGRAYRETDPFGGYDPYSASKGACEIVISSYRRSFFNDPEGPVWVASARAGNVIGGGDWALDPVTEAEEDQDAVRACATRRRRVRGSTCSSRSAATSASARRWRRVRASPTSPPASTSDPTRRRTARWGSSSPRS